MTCPSPPGPESDSLPGAADRPLWAVKLLYDGECPLCMREVRMLQRRDRDRGRIAFVDLADPAYDPAAHGGVDYARGMARIHAVLADGRVISGVEVFRVAYEQVGLGWVYALTRLAPVAKLAEAIYTLWARYRLPLTGREALPVILARRKSCPPTPPTAAPGQRPD